MSTANIAVTLSTATIKNAQPVISDDGAGIFICNFIDIRRNSRS